ncbi:MAG TPA: hypothetical protein VGL66_14875 [Caulobacteraceae bacterium]|jgi:hypothetical protein
MAERNVEINRVAYSVGGWAMFALIVLTILVLNHPDKPDASRAYFYAIRIHRGIVYVNIWQFATYVSSLIALVSAVGLILIRQLSRAAQKSK